MARYLMTVDEVMEELNVSKTLAYKLMREMNEKLQAHGYTTLHGRVSRRFFEEQFYGMGDTYNKGA